MKSNMQVLVGLVAVMWAVEVLNGFMGHSLNEYGMLPRTTGGLIGIPMSPFLHAGIGHVLSNTIPLLALGSLTVLQTRNAFGVTTLFIVCVGGAGVWLIGRPDFHVGASGLVFGYFGFPGLPHAKRMRSIELFATQVAPHLREPAPVAT